MTTESSDSPLTGESWEPAFVGLPNGNVIRDVNGELNGLVMVGNVAFVSFNIDNFPNGYEQVCLSIRRPRSQLDESLYR